MTLLRRDGTACGREAACKSMGGGDTAESKQDVRNGRSWGYPCVEALHVHYNAINKCISNSHEADRAIPFLQHAIAQMPSYTCKMLTCYTIVIPPIRCRSTSLVRELWPPMFRTHIMISMSKADVPHSSDAMIVREMSSRGDGMSGSD